MHGAESFAKVCGPDLPREVLVALLVRAAADILSLQSTVGRMEVERNVYEETLQIIRSSQALRDQGLLTSGAPNIPRSNPQNGAYARTRAKVRAKRLS